MQFLFFAFVSKASFRWLFDFEARATVAMPRLLLYLSAQISFNLFRQISSLLKSETKRLSAVRQRFFNCNVREDDKLVKTIFDVQREIASSVLHAKPQIHERRRKLSVGQC